MRRAHRFRAALAGLLAVGALLGPLAGCTEQAAPVGPFQRLGRKAAQRGVPRVGPDARAVAAARRWGLGAPLAPAPRPAVGRGPELSFVVDHVPMRAKVVFLTFDDGPGVDPAFVRMVHDLGVPVTLFPNDGGAAGAGAGAGADGGALPGRDRSDVLRALGAGVHNHALHHRDLRALDYEGQRAEICGRQGRLAARAAAIRPRFFRPPYGAYDASTLRAAKECGISAVVLARAGMTPEGLRYAGGAHGLRAGDIVRGSLPAAGGGGMRGVVRLLEEVRVQGFAVGRLEDYL
ncbi:Bifunctional xylanase/xylan deacetylase [Streptomyces hundungensis]|uniref:Bifunctional xylanase/xylan deacetylase n=1 Tax=Streptomyces hundungensis TaxID=1077946 RepID=A0A387HBZ2_9ACTN|nr:polysaccharide deacetylase family protein [Streptomyces hundungensis]AYG81024.1 Bifunctional xylanase/xylan deacetylase [Streptomyces hundungensis]